ncbi:hypothetical protein [Rhodobacter maris]|uniref:Uncharacterized protein n=1 Tax=Rhodobacter maris TaxID=446682 RepID=A0A285TNP9_9RHOB|nr:hypothetical protein [Rhodobacter maris]SOC22195.1 hypothetical protein SAMN05877831_1298 [Rhodobacter maris]
MSMMGFPGGRVVPATVLAELAVRELTGTADPAATRGLSGRDRAQFRSWVEVLDWALSTRAVTRGELWARREGSGGPVEVVLSLSKMQALSQAYVMAQARAPESCGPEIVAAPARGACRVITMRQIRPGTRNTIEEAGYQGPGEARPRKAVRAADVFDRMEARARATGKPVPFTPGQIAMARLYRTLVERHAAGGVKLSSLEGRRGGSGGGALDVTDLRLEEARRIALLRARIGEGAAMVVRRVRPSARGPGASVILDRRLVDAVCLEDLDPSAVLLAHGWAPKGEHRERLRRALGAALERMQGYP